MVWGHTLELSQPARDRTLKNPTLLLEANNYQQLHSWGSWACESHPLQAGLFTALIRYSQPQLL